MNFFNDTHEEAKYSFSLLCNLHRIPDVRVLK